ncbi:MAG: GAF domain-containing protein [Anaerolineales bacterium]
MKSLFLISPTALNYVPVLILHLVSLGYLLHKRPKSRPTWLFCGWLGGMTFMTATQAAACALYVPRVSAYLGWWGGVIGVTLAMIALLQFAYHFPRLRYPREARLVLYISILVTALLFTWMLWETLTALPHHVGPLSSVQPETAITDRATWLLYEFERFNFGFAAQRDAEGLVSYQLFDLWQLVGNSWILLVWLRKTVHSSTPRPSGPIWRRAWTALRHARGQEALQSRAWVLLMLLAPFPVLASALDAMGALPPGSFAAVHLLVLFAIMLTYLNYAPEPSSFMVKLVGVSLVTLLVILGLVAGYAMRAYQEAYTQTRRAEVEHIRTLVEEERLDRLSAEVRYVATRPVAGLFATEYRMSASTPAGPTASSLSAHDALLREGLAHNHYPAYLAVLREHPWLGLEGARRLMGSSRTIAALTLPEEAITYRGTLAPPAEQVIRYTFREEDTLYEVGYGYLGYRAYLHRAALPFVTLLLGTTLAILVLFPRFFRLGLVAPLTQLLEGVHRVNEGELNIRVPVVMEDEIGHLTHAFNRMVESLSSSEEQLRALNLTLEQRVSDRTRDLATLYEIAEIVSRTEALDTLFEAALAQAIPAVDGVAGFVLLTDGGEEQLTLAAQHGLSPELLARLIPAPFWQKVWEQNEVRLVHDVDADPRVAPLLPSRLPDGRPLPYPTLVGLPIPGRDQTLGVLGLCGASPYLFNVEDLGLLQTLAEQLGVAVENVRLRERAATAIVLEERQRLARDLHDSVTQILYSQTLFAAAAAKSLQTGDGARTTHYLKRLGEAAGRALREMRLMIYRLRPPELAQAGLVGALRRRLELVEQRAGLETSLTAEEALALPTEMERALYHIAEEGLNNALKHAMATTARVELRREGEEIVLSVSDDGCGFDPARVSSGLGLQSLCERAEGLGGTCTIQSEADTGTRVLVRLPWPDEERPS